jgi:hypothetical protein
MHTQLSRGGHPRISTPCTETMVDPRRAMSTITQSSLAPKRTGEPSQGCTLKHAGGWPQHGDAVRHTQPVRVQGFHTTSEETWSVKVRGQRREGHMHEGRARINNKQSSGPRLLGARQATYWPREHIGSVLQQDPSSVSVAPDPEEETKGGGGCTRWGKDTRTTVYDNKHAPGTKCRNCHTSGRVLCAHTTHR